jgi:hypothetical protein
LKRVPAKIPSAAHTAALADPAIIPAAAIVALQNAARARGIELAVFTTDAPDQIAPAVDKANH